jgi:hypothetical protein
MANGRFPASNQILLSPSNADLVIVRATYGILLSFDRGATWTFLCEDALGLPQAAGYDPALALTASNALVAGLLLPAGLEVSSDTGCNWRCAAGSLANEAIADIAVRPDAPHTVVALTSTAFFDDAGGGWHSQGFLSTNDGADWTPLGRALDPSVLVTTIDVAPSDAHRLYVSASAGFGATRTAVLYASTDDGAMWTAHPVPLDTTLESSIYIGAVDPIDADRVYVRTSGQSRLLVTADAGQSFQPVLALTGQMLGFALSPDGSKIYAGSAEDGLFVGDRATLTFSHRSPLHVQCLATRGPELWACSDETVGFVAGVSMDDGAHFVPKLHLESARAAVACKADSHGPLACGADANAAQCSGGPFEQLCMNVGCTPDAAAPDGGAVSVAPRPGGACRCAVSGANRRVPAPLLAAPIAMAIAVLRRQRRRRAKA